MSYRNDVLDRLDAIRRRHQSRMDASAKMAYGIAKSMGIDTNGMEPKEVWEAIAEKRGTSIAKAKKDIVRTAKNKKTDIPGNRSTIKKVKITKQEHKKYIGPNECSMAKEVGGYVRKNNFEHGYSHTAVDGWSLSGTSGITVRNNTDENGNYTVEREAKHSECIDAAFEGVKKPEGQPRCVFMGGGPGSGKSYVAKTMKDEFGLFASGEAVSCDPDFCKKFLPEYDPKNPRVCHNESSDMAARIRSIALNEGYNTLIDGTGDGGADWMKQQIKQARDAGHSVEGRYVFMPIENALELNRKRERTIPDSDLIRLHAAVAKVIPDIASEFDDFKLFANVLNGEPKLIASCKRGEKINVADEDLWKQVLETANYYNKKG